MSKVSPRLRLHSIVSLGHHFYSVVAQNVRQSSRQDKVAILTVHFLASTVIQKHLCRGVHGVSGGLLQEPY